jgi:SEC-C motif-containing protein
MPSQGITIRTILGEVMDPIQGSFAMMCPCGSEKEYSACCGPLHKGDLIARSPEALMRSRYSAFVLKLYAYLKDTIDPQVHRQFDFDSQDQWAETAQFLQLEILGSNEEKNKGLVEFIARYELQGKQHIHHEISKFRKQYGKWFFRDGKILSSSED